MADARQIDKPKQTRTRKPRVCYVVYNENDDGSMNPIGWTNDANLVLNEVEGGKASYMRVATELKAS